jgi:hypothetical protein
MTNDKFLKLAIDMTDVANMIVHCKKEGLKVDEEDLRRSQLLLQRSWIMIGLNEQIKKDNFKRFKKDMDQWEHDFLFKKS